ncbi:MAG: hypothetical protein ACI8QS_000592 [Planctomycetota bacterium]|jgi:hypothetical protein
MEHRDQFNAPLSCEDYQGEIPLVVGGDLEPEIMDLLVAHLAECDPCADLTAEAARVRDVLLEGLSLGAEQWKEPSLWPGIAAAMGAGVNPLIPRLEDHQARDPRSRTAGRLRLLARPARYAGLVAVAATLLFLFKPWSSEQPIGGPNQPNPAVADSEDQLPNGAAVVPGGDATTLASVGTVGLPADAIPAGLVPLTARDIQELSEAAPLWVDSSRSDGVLRIRQGQGQTLASFPAR